MPSDDNVDRLYREACRNFDKPIRTDAEIKADLRAQLEATFKRFHEWRARVQL